MSKTKKKPPFKLDSEAKARHRKFLKPRNISIIKEKACQMLYILKLGDTPPQKAKDFIYEDIYDEEHSEKQRWNVILHIIYEAIPRLFKRERIKWIYSAKDWFINRYMDKIKTDRRKRLQQIQDEDDIKYLSRAELREEDGSGRKTKYIKRYEELYVRDENGKELLNPNIEAIEQWEAFERNIDLNTLMNDDSLTRREKEIIRLTKEGNDRKEISEKLGIKPETVKDHLANAYRKMRQKAGQGE